MQSTLSSVTRRPSATLRVISGAPDDDADDPDGGIAARARCTTPEMSRLLRSARRRHPPGPVLEISRRNVPWPVIRFVVERMDVRVTLPRRAPWPSRWLRPRSVPCRTTSAPTPASPRSWTWCVLRHDDDSPDAVDGGREGHALRVISGGRRDHAAAFLRVGEYENLFDRPASDEPPRWNISAFRRTSSPSARTGSATSAAVSGTRGFPCAPALLQTQPARRSIDRHHKSRGELIGRQHSQVLRP